MIPASAQSLQALLTRSNACAFLPKGRRSLIRHGSAWQYQKQLVLGRIVGAIRKPRKLLRLWSIKAGSRPKVLTDSSEKQAEPGSLPTWERGPCLQPE